MVSRQAHGLLSMAEERKGPLDWWVHDGVEYGIYQEGGFHHAGRLAQETKYEIDTGGVYTFIQSPFMVPAVEAVRPQWNKKWREFFKRWK